MKLKCMIFAVVACLVLASGAFAFNVVSDSNGAFSLDGPATDFTNWALAGGATSNGFMTVNEGAITHDWYISGTDVPSAYAQLTIPFNFSAPLTSCVLNYGASVWPYGNNYGWVQIILVTPSASTKIFSMSSDSTDPTYANYNYTQSQNPAGNWTWYGYTDISDRIAGQTQFSLEVAVQTGWSAFVYNGGAFLPTAFSQSDFVMSGTTAVPEPGSMLTLCAGLMACVACVRRRR